MDRGRHHVLTHRRINILGKGDERPTSQHMIYKRTTEGELDPVTKTRKLQHAKFANISHSVDKPPTDSTAA